MDYQQPTVPPLQKTDINRGEDHDNHSLPLAGSEDETSSPFSTVKEPESCVHPDPGFTGDSTSSNLAANVAEPFDQPVTVPFQDTSPSLFTDTTREPLEPRDPNPLTSFTTSHEADCASKFESQTQQQSLGSSVPRRPSPSMSVYSFERPLRESRYYAQALSAEDKLVLLRAEQNHSLQKRSGENTLAHNEACNNLVPRMIPRVEKTNSLVGMEHNRQQSQRALSRPTERVRKFFGIPRTKVDKAKDDESIYTQSRRASQPTYNTRSSTLSPPQPPPLPASRSAPSFQEFIDNTPHYSASHTRTASNGDYFSRPPNPRTSTYNNHHISPLASISGPPSSTSNTSTCVRSPLAQEVEVKFRANPETTFDSLLAPHRSGKGEVLRDSRYAQKVVTPKTSPSPSPSPSPKSKAKTRRLTKMPSMPLLLRRGSGTEGG
ncbi:hypothetical protein G6011_06930 [Alternaria panax]|uniref:Uncharacterized protein n=1 Tax=Alternaria panax TaxID=48097 RepID=A0AAD4FDN6_9PLEO|nr:hypothetical protein G6011_06930 [Alternaria panax]